MKRIATYVGVATIGCGCTQDASLRLDLDHLQRPPKITDCGADYRERGHHNEQPLDSGPDARVALDMDLKASMPGGLADLHAVEPLCFYLVPEGRLLVRDGRGFEYYFRKVPKWVPDKVVVPTSGPSQ